MTSSFLIVITGLIDKVGTFFRYICRDAPYFLPNIGITLSLEISLPNGNAQPKRVRSYLANCSFFEYIPTRTIGYLRGFMSTSISAKDVAAYIMSKCKPMTAMKLQKLVYYSQAWSLVWDEKPLFTEEIEAWANGPIVPDLYQLHKGMFELSSWSYGSVDKLGKKEIETIDAVLKFYGDKTGQYLSELTHNESPWKLARTGLIAGQRSNVVITHSAMHEYYGSL